MTITIAELQLLTSAVNFSAFFEENQAQLMLRVSAWNARGTVLKLK